MLNNTFEVIVSNNNKHDYCEFISHIVLNLSIMQFTYYYNGNK